MHINFGLFADILRELAATVGRIPKAPNKIGCRSARLLTCYFSEHDIVARAFPQIRVGRLEKGPLASTDCFRLVFSRTSSVADRIVPRRAACFLRETLKVANKEPTKMDTQRVVRFAVGVWVVLFAIAFLSSVVVEIIRDRKTKRGYRPQLVGQPFHLLQSQAVVACDEPAVDRSEEIAEAELIECF